MARRARRDGLTAPRASRIALGLAFAALSALGCAATDVAMHLGEVPAELGRAGYRGVAVPAGPGLVDVGRAAAVAREAVPIEGDGIRRDAWLLRITDTQSGEGGGPVGRTVWLVVASGLEMRFGGPSTPPGVPPGRGHVAHQAYVLVDAETGRALETGFIE